MKRYMIPDNERFRFYVRPCLNGYAIQVLVVPTDENIPLTPSVAAQLQIDLPEVYRLQCCTRVAADEMLDQVASLNGWLAIE